jgi:hypothetical protein
MGLGTWAAGYLAFCFGRGIWGLFLLPFVLYWLALAACFWACAEIVLWTVTGALTIGAVLNREAKPADITLLPLKWHLYMIGLKGARR